MRDEMLAWCQADGSNGSSPQGPLATLPCRLVSRGGRFETNTWIVPAGPLEGVGRRLIGPGARRQLATSLPDFYEWPEGLRGAVRVREAKWVEYVGGKIEDRIARIPRGVLLLCVSPCNYLLNELRQHSKPAPS
jgi:hypothetical protein